MCKEKLVNCSINSTQVRFLLTYSYSKVPNRRVSPNKREGANPFTVAKKYNDSVELFIT